MLCLKKFSLFICTIFLWTNTDVVQSKYVYQSEAQRWIGQNKIVATWEEANKNCYRAGAILASPINEQLLKYMKSYITVNGHCNPYFIGMKLRSGPEVQYVSVEGIPLDDLPEPVIDMIEQLDPRDGDCLSMDRDSICVVPCWQKLPYICYTNMTTNGTVTEKPISAENTTMEVSTQHTTPVQEVSEVTHKTTKYEEVTSTTPRATIGYGVAIPTIPPATTEHAVLTSTTSHATIGYAEVTSTTPHSSTGYAGMTSTTPHVTTEVLTSTPSSTTIGYPEVTSTTPRTTTGYGEVTSTTPRATTSYAGVTSTTSHATTGYAEVTSTTPRATTGYAVVTSTTPLASTGYVVVTSTTPRTTIGYPIVTSTTPRAPNCDYEGYKYYPQTDSCYKVNFVREKWINAKTTCEIEGAYLVILNDENEARTIQQILRDVYIQKAWTGLQDENGHGDWRSVHGHSLDEIYKQNYFLHLRNRGRCAAIHAGNGILYEFYCTESLSFICERDI